MPGRNRGDGSKREPGEDFVVEVGKDKRIVDGKKSIEGVGLELEKEDYASGNEPYDKGGSSVARGPGTTRPSLSTGLRTEVIHSTHKTGIQRASSIGVVGQVGRSVIRTPDRSRQKQIADLAAAVSDPKLPDLYYWGPDDRGATETEVEKPTQPSQVQVGEVVQPTVDRQPNLENLSPEIQLRALIDRYVINSKNPEIKAQLQGTSVAKNYTLFLSFKNDKGGWVADTQRPITGNIKAVLRQLEARLRDYKEKQNK